jgi:NAD-dependent deacetylase
MSAIQELQAYIDQSERIVFFGGAGVSTESGIPDFRSVDGLYNQKYKYPPETMLSYSFFLSHPEDFYAFYHDKVVHRDAKPNTAHLKLAELEHARKVSAVITQNIDGLHQAAGSQNVLELHGSIWRNYCMKCGKTYDISDVMESAGIPRCECGGVIRPDVVLYEEPLDEYVLLQAQKHLREADLLIIGGTSLVVYPAAGLVSMYSGPLILINKSVTAQDRRASLLINENIGAVMGQLKVNQ